MKTARESADPLAHVALRRDLPSLDINRYLLVVTTIPEAERCRPEVFPVVDVDDVDVVAARLDLPEMACAVLGQLLSPPERERAGRFRSAEHRNRYIVARARLRELLAARLKIEPAEIGIATAEHGKPVLAEAHAASGWEFNLSHSGDMAVYAFARGRPVGIDVERIRDVPHAADIAERFFSPTEAAAYRALPESRRNLAFLACWTRKEAFIKALGEGLSHPLDAFDVSLDLDRPAQITRIGNRTGPDFEWSLTSFRIGPDYVGAVVRATRLLADYAQG